MGANSEFFEALDLLARERGVSQESLIEKIKAAIVHAVRRDYGGEDNIFVDIDPEKEGFKIYIRKDVVEKVENPQTQMTVDEAKTYRSRARVGSVIDIPIKVKKFGRIAAVNAKHVIRQGIKDVERNQIYEELQSKENELVNAVVNRVDPVKGNAVVLIGKSEAILPKNEQVPGEVLTEGQHIKVYVVDVDVNDRGPRILISRTHPGLVKRLFENEVPEIFDGTVEIKNIAREAGQRTKIAVVSHDENVDPRGACIGPRGSRVANIVEELGGEKIDVILYSDDPGKFIAEALSPANVVSVEVTDPEEKVCRVTVPDYQLSLAIGNKGQNARLAAKLTGYKIDIRPESGYYGEED
ncbi:MAG: transcription termination/antitermination protein NusA [Oscillospiraceae bacterium]|nr:transcription termination/antitermination protein NusA [Oscillospiraceae bacterium]